MLTVEKHNITIRKSESTKLQNVRPGELRFGRDFSDHMFISKYRGGQWQEHQIVPYGDIPLSPATCALHYGQAIFEGMKAYKGKDGVVRLFRPERNAARMNVSAKRMCMPEFPEDMFMSGLTELIKLDRAWVPEMEGCSLYIRPFIFADEVFLGVKPASDYKFMIICSPASSYYPEPVKVKIEKDFSRSVEGGVGFAKAAGNYAAALYPTSLAAQEGYHQIIWTDSKEHKYIEEAGTMNLMFVIDGVFVTPSLESETILSGITRDSVIHIAKDLGYDVDVRRISVDEIVEAGANGKLTDAFGMGTAANIAPIRSIGHERGEIVLPDVSERTQSNQISKMLSDIKYGEIDDPYGWTLEV